MTRVYGLGRNEKHHYPAYSPRVVFHRVRHWAIGPLLGCSCSRCFKSRWRLMYSNPAIDRFVKVERRVDKLEKDFRRNRMRRAEFPTAETIEMLREEARHDVQVNHQVVEIEEEMREYAEDLLTRLGEGR